MDIPAHQTRSRGYLPHWEADAATYSVVFRLADSLPQSVLYAYKRERMAIIEVAASMHRDLSPDEWERLAFLFSDRIDRALDQGIGQCYLRQPAIGQLMVDALQHFHKSRYFLHTWCVMPNHVHVLFSPVAPHGLETILHSWKSFTATMANRALGGRGAFWMPEYYDHLVRDEADLRHAHQYILENPTKAGLGEWPWCGTNLQG